VAVAFPVLKQKTPAADGDFIVPLLVKTASVDAYRVSAPHAVRACIGIRRGRN